MPGVWKKAGEGLLSLLFFAVVGGALYWIYAPPAIPETVPYQGVELQRGVHYVTSRAWPKRTWYSVEAPSVTLRRPVVLKWLVSTDSGVGIAEQSPLGAVPSTSPVTVLVHGYSAPEHKMGSYFAPLIEQLRAGTDTSSTFIVYDWPSTARRFEDLTIEQRRDWLSPPVGAPGQGSNWFGGINWEANAYNADLEAARTAGAAGLIALLDAMKARVDPQRINLVAHSMGSLVVIEAASRAPESFAGLRRLLLLAPDLPHDALESPKLSEAIRRVDQVHVFFSANDDILRLSQIKSRIRRLGRDGPANRSALPGNVTLHDMKDVLGTGDQVHSRYLEPPGSAAVASVLN
ncbi:MAG: alpha/beta fold hydrolase [Bacteroidota bacterium]